jgi:hypothetical protein
VLGIPVDRVDDVAIGVSADEARPPGESEEHVHGLTRKRPPR